MEPESAAHRNGAEGSFPRTPPGGIEEILHRLVSLVELQAELFRADLRDGLRRVLMAAGLLVGGAAVGLATMCVLLIFVAELLTDAGGLYRSVAFLIAFVVGLAATAGLVGGAIWCLRNSVGILDRSRQEWGRTINWVKHTLRHPTSPAKDA